MTGLGFGTVGRYLHALLREKAAHICSWSEDVMGRNTLRIVKLGKGTNVPRPRISDVERGRRYRARKKAMMLTQVLGGAGRFMKASNGQLQFEKLQGAPV